MAAGSFEKSCYLYEKIYLYCGMAAIFFLLLAIVLFFLLHIPRAFGEITGRKARKALRERAGKPEAGMASRGEGAEETLLLRDAKGRRIQ